MDPVSPLVGQSVRAAAEENDAANAQGIGDRENDVDVRTPGEKGEYHRDKNREDQDTQCCEN